MKIYDKEIISELKVNLFNRSYKVIVSDNEKQNMYDVHIITSRYAKDELNTLFLQEPKGSVSADKFDKLYLTMIVTEFALWDELYGYRDKSYTFSIKINDKCDI